jgi:ADP-heptose:LPS heptosyltransferase
MRFLIARLSSLGDVVCSLPAASTLKAAFPDSEITWAVDPRFAGVVECCSAVDVVANSKPLGGSFDAALDLQGLLKSGRIVAQAKSPIKLGYHWQREGSWLFSRPVLPDPTSIHIVDQYIDVARAAVAALGGTSPDGPANFRLASRFEEAEEVRAMLEERGVAGEYALLNPGAGWATKRWPPRHFAKVVDWLWAHDLAPVALGGPSVADMEAYSEVAKECERAPIKMTGATGIQKLIALVAGARIHLGGDTGSSHLAAALGIPAIGLYSITRPERSCPYGQIERCLYAREGLSKIEPEQVIAQIEPLLK